MIPDVTGFILEKALKKLETAGITDTEIVLTSPPRAVVGFNGNSRVIRQIWNESSGKVQLVVCNTGIE